MPAGFAGVLMRAMDLNAEARPQTAAQMRQMFRESENYAYLVENTLANSASVSPHLYAQQTQILPGRTSSPGAAPADMRTELLTENVSQVTSVRSLGSFSGSETATVTRSTTQSPPPSGFRWGKAMAAAAVAILVVCGLGAGGLFVTNPTIFGTDTATDKSTESGPAKTDTATTDNPASTAEAQKSVAAAGEQRPSIDGPAPTDRAKAPEKPEAPADAPKASKPSTQNDHPRDDPQFTHIPGDSDTGDIIVTTPGVGGKTTTTRVFPLPPVTNGRGAGQPQPQKPGAKANTFPPDFDFSKGMTPEQARKLKMLMRTVQRPPAKPPIKDDNN